MAKRTTKDRIEAVLYLVGCVGLVVAVRATADRDALAQLAGSPFLLAAGLVMALLSQAAAGANWIALLAVDRDLRPLALRALYGAQLTKYVPAGGIVQVASQVALTQRLGLSWARVTVAVLVANGQVVLAGAAVGSVAAASRLSESPMRFLAALMPVALLLSAPPFLRFLLQTGSRLWSRLPSVADLPDGRYVLGGLVASMVNFVALCTAFSLVMLSMESDIDLLVVGSAFAFAWIAGFVVLPLPGGIGIREGVLIWLLPSVDNGSILSAALALRTLSLVAEFSAWAAAAALSRRRSAADVEERRTAPE